MREASIRWYVVQTQPHAEARAAAHLRRQGFDVYLPRYLKRRHHARKVEMVPAPLFPRYLFVAIDVAQQRWRSVRGTVGVSHLVCNGEEPAPLPFEVVDEIRARETENGFVALDLQHRFAPGDRVRVLDGVFSSSVGLFEENADNNRVRILLDLLGRKVRVVMDCEALDAA